MLEINTSNYTASKHVKIDDVALEVRPMTTSEVISLTTFPNRLQDVATDIEQAEKVMREFEDTFFAIFDDPKKAKQVFDKIPTNRWMEVYNKIMTEA